jgi:FAD/FMN-containing dehydrogenase
MSTLNLAAESGLAAASELRQEGMQGRIVLPDDPNYEQARRLFNAAVDHRPTLIALCETVKDVQAAVRVARARELDLSVRGGGHDWAGRAVRHGGLVIDLSRMRQVKIDARAQVATIEGGATGDDLIGAAARHGLAAVTGAAGSVGVTGLTIGGGYGPLSPHFGLAIDNLLAARV